MTALAGAAIRTFLEGHPPKLEKFPVLTNTVLHTGSGVCAESAVGYARPVAASLTAPEFYGFAEEPANNNPGASGALEVMVRQEGVIELAAITGMTGITNVGDTVYMADDGTGFTATSTNNVAIGKVINFINGMFRVHFQASALRSI